MRYVFATQKELEQIVDELLDQPCLQCRIVTGETARLSECRHCELDTWFDLLRDVNNGGPIKLLFTAEVILDTETLVPACSLSARVLTAAYPSRPNSSMAASINGISAEREVGALAFISSFSR